eukprot:jgi/Ulvmu1/7865/UM004_0096.1
MCCGVLCRWTTQQLPRCRSEWLQHDAFAGFPAIAAALHNLTLIGQGRYISASGTPARKSNTRNRTRPSIVKPSISGAASRKQGPVQVPKWFSYGALCQPNASIIPALAWSASDRDWLASCLNTVFDRCVTLAPSDGISISTLMSHRKAFARWLYLHLTPKTMEFLRLADRSSNASLTAVMWPIIRDYMHSKHSAAMSESQRLLQLANMTKPHTWYPLAAGVQQQVIYHAGPTNSGKTYSALQALKAAQSGVYCAPLRLLALEIFERLNEQKLACDLVTGQERNEVPGAQHVSCTVEMANTAQLVDVAVIDEIQLLAHESRGWAWTRALLGLPAREVHVCGDHSCTDLVRTLCSLTGKEFKLHTYERLTPLSVGQSGLGDGGYRGLQRGDCVIAFSRRELYKIKAEIESKTTFKAAIIYGALPPEARRTQAQLFNDPESEYQVLVASDAIGMGITLNLRRIIFHSLRSFRPDTKALTPLDPAHVKQIAGRAGRKGTQWEHGLVTTREPLDMAHLEHSLSMQIDEKASTSAGLLPTFEQVEEYATSRGYPETSTFSAILQQFAIESQQEQLYFLCSHAGMLAIAKATDEIPELSLKDRAAMCTAPVDEKNRLVFNAFLFFIHRYAEDGSVVLDMTLPTDSPKNIAEMSHCEAAYQVVSIWLWLSMRFAEAFPERHVAEECEERLQSLMCEGLAKISESAGRGPDDSELQARPEFSGMLRPFAFIPSHRQNVAT